MDWLELPDPPDAVGLGIEGVPAGRGAGALRAVARGAGRVDRPAAPDRRAAPGLRRAGRADPHAGGSTGWPPSATRAAAGSPPRSPRSPSTTGCRWRSARRGAGNRKGVVEKANHTAAQRWWRTLADDMTRRAGPGRLGPVVSALRGDTRHAPHRRRQVHRGHRRRGRAVDRRCRRRSRPSWPSRGSPRAQALVAFRGNRYSVPPELARAPVTVTRTGSAPPHIELATSSGIVIARHQLAAGRGRRHRPRHRTRPRPGTRRAWPRSPPPRRTGASSASHPARPPEPPPQPCAPATPHRHRPHQTPDRRAGDEVVVDLARYAAAAQGRNTLP